MQLLLALTSKQTDLNQQLKYALAHDAPQLEISILRQALERLNAQIEQLEKKQNIISRDPH